MTDASRLDAFLAAQRLTNDYELSDLSPQEINRLSMADYARIRESAGLPPVDPFEQAYSSYEPPGRPRQDAPAVPQTAPEATETAPQGIDLADMTMEQYAQIRAQLGVGGREYGKGALDGGSTADWVQAAQHKAGRSGWQGANVVEPLRLTDRYINHDDLRDTRSAAQRFSTPGNAFGI